MLPDNISIELTTDSQDFAACTDIMYKSEPWTRYGMTYTDCLKAFGGAFKEIILIKNDDAIIGFAILQTQGSFNGYIQTLAVSSDHRGGGYGTMLLKFCEKRILQYSPNVFICVSEFNAGALKLYKKFGFELVGELKNFLKEGISELLLRKTISPLLGYKPATAKS